MSISFNTIPNLLLTPGPYIEYDGSRAVQGLVPLPNRVLLIGARLASGSVAASIMQRIRSVDDGDTMFGRGSQLSRMIRAFKKVNRLTELWAIALTGAGTAATKTITATGTITSDGTLHFWVGGIGPIDVAITSGMTVTQVATAIDTAFAIYEADWSYSFAPSVGVVTGTCRHAAAFGQDFDIRLNYGEREALDMPAGLTITIADGVAGATDPDVTASITAIGDEWFTTIVSGFNGDANVDVLESYGDDTWGPMVQHDTMVFVGFSGSHAAALTYADSRNSKFTVVPFLGVTPTPWWEIAAATAAASTAEPDPARPRQTLAVKGVLPSSRETLFTREDRELLLEAGVSTFKVASDGAVSIERLCTTYVTNANSIADSTFRNLETMLTLSAIRYTTRARIATKYPRHKLANDDAAYGPGQAVVTPKVIRGELIALFREWETNAWVEDAAQFKEELIVERNASDPDRLDALLGPNLVNQFRVFAAQIQFLL